MGAATPDRLACIEMANRIKELEEHILLMKKNSADAVLFLKYQLFDCLDTKKILEKEINNIDKHPISPPVKSLNSRLKESETASKINSLNEENESLKNEIQRLKGENLRKDLKLQEMQEKLKCSQELLETETKEGKEQQILIEVLETNPTEQTEDSIEMISHKTQTSPAKKRNIFIRGAHRISKRCHEAFARYCSIF